MDDKNWEGECCNCGQSPTVVGEDVETGEKYDTELCGPCCFGEAETFGGNW